MAKEEAELDPQDKPADVPSDSELFVNPVGNGEPQSDQSLLREPENLSERDVFAGDENLYRFLAKAGRKRTSQARHAENRPALANSAIRSVSLSTVQKTLVVSIIIVAVILACELFIPPSRSTAKVTTMPFSQQPHADQQPSPDPTQTMPVQTPALAQEPQPATKQALSLRLAETLYQQKDYRTAYAAYYQLQQSLLKNPIEDHPFKELLQLKMALCLKGTLTTGEAIDIGTRTANLDQADHLLKALLQSPSPAVKVMANYHKSLIEMQKQQYLKARTRACQAVALVDATDFDSNWVSALKRECRFLIAEAVTRYVLSLRDADKDIPHNLWTKDSLADPFANLNETQLWMLLNAGIEQLDDRLLSPSVQKLQHKAGSADSAPPRWSVVCNRAPIEELLARFATSAGLELHWSRSTVQPQQPTQDEQMTSTNSGPQIESLRKRPISMCVLATTMSQFVSTAAGCTGLLARLDDKAVITMLNPTTYSSLSDQIDLLSRHAICLWQEFLLAYHSDRRTPNAHFAMGLLHEQIAQVTEAIAEYKLVANAFSQTSLAPFALLHSSRLKTNLHDYTGARKDLQQLIEQYPDTDLSGPAYLLSVRANAFTRHSSTNWRTSG
jgi:tetratricopeptide (TPR) repeat protein